MSPVKLFAHGLAGCSLAEGSSTYLLPGGSPTNTVAVNVSLLFAEPCLHRLLRGELITTELANAMGYRIIRSYDDAVAWGLA
jgi:hypothetical protein